LVPGAAVAGDDAGASELVEDVSVNDIATMLEFAAVDDLAVEEEIQEVGSAGEVGFHERAAVQAVPIEGARRFHDAFAVTVIGIGDASGPGQLIFGVVGVSGDAGNTDDISGCVIVVAAKLVFQQ